ncbi:MAG: glycosyltransferase family 2 protein, partial [Bacteroidales bacterium]
MVALVNYLLAPRVGRKRIKNPESSFPEKVSILIPCRNEYENIGILLENLKAVKYGILEILVYDDNSDDNTAEIVLHYAATDHRIKLIPGKTKPQGWQGKTHACDQLSRNASGKYMLFLDADVRMTADGFYSLYKDMLTKDYDLMTVFPSQLCVSKGEKLVVPVMHRILLTLLPVPLMRQKFFSSLSAANGQVMFFKSVTYNSYHLHERFKMAVVEDISIVRFMKREKLNVMCFLGNGYIHCRMYTS